MVIGSQSILAQFPDAPAEVLVSVEADVYPPDRPELAHLVDGAIGEGSQFHEQFGYYAQGVGPDTAVLPEGWQRRLVSIQNENTAGVEALCLEVHDLAISKYVAGREKDRVFTLALARSGLTREATLRSRLAATRLDAARRKLAAARIETDFAAAPARRRTPPKRR